MIERIAFIAALLATTSALAYNEPRPSERGSRGMVVYTKCMGSGDTASLQAAGNSILATGGGALYLPPGTCDISGGLTFDIGNINSSASYKPTLKIVGAGTEGTQLKAYGISGAAVKFIGSNQNTEAYLILEDFTILGNQTSGSIGLQTSYTAFSKFSGLAVMGFNTGWEASDIEQVSVTDSEFRWNTNGINFLGAVGTGKLTGSNSIVFENVAIGNNFQTGITVNNFAAITFIGGSVQYNGGAAGTAENYGALFKDSTGASFCGYNNLAFVGTVFEGNGGLYDLAVNSSYCHGAAVNLEAASFLRGPSNYATNQIAMLGRVAQNLKISSTTFVYGVGYTPSAGRPSITLTNTLAQVTDDGSNYWQSALETPTYNAWTSYTPTITCSSGSPSASTATARYKRVNKTYWITWNANITNVSGCSGANIYATMPPGVVSNPGLSVYPGSAVDASIGAFYAGAITASGLTIMVGSPSSHNYFGSATFEAQ